MLVFLLYEGLVKVREVASLCKYVRPPPATAHTWYHNKPTQQQYEYCCWNPVNNLVVVGDVEDPRLPTADYRQ